MTPAHRQQHKDLSTIYGNSGSKQLSQEGTAVMELIRDLNLPIHKDAAIRSKLLELDSYKNMPKKYFSALSDVLVHAISSADSEEPAKANS